MWNFLQIFTAFVWHGHYFMIGNIRNFVHKANGSSQISQLSIGSPISLLQMYVVINSPGHKCDIILLLERVISNPIICIL